MYSYASRVVPEDRWAIVAYIKALQLSQNATVADADPEALADSLKPKEEKSDKGHGADHGGEHAGGEGAAH